MTKRYLMVAMSGLLAWFTATGWAQDPAAEKLSVNDQLRVHVQKLCPVSGQELGSMGDPIKVKMGEQDVFLCCAGCIGKRASAEHWKTIQQRRAQAQGTCPIMGQPVAATKKSTVVEGEQIFVCCPPCIEEIQADPKPALVKLHASYAAFVKSESLVAAQTAVQAICPVSGESLGSMGPPISTEIDGQSVLLCCDGCREQGVDPAHWSTVHENLRKGQGNCLVTGDALPEGAESVLVDGQRVFVCCPECVEAVQNDPANMLEKLAERYATSDE